MSDDGYANNLSVAHDVLRDLNLPWTLFVSTRHIIPPSEIRHFSRGCLSFAPSAKYDIANLDAHLTLSDSEDRARTADRWVGALTALDAERAQPPSIRCRLSLQILPYCSTGILGRIPHLARNRGAEGRRRRDRGARPSSLAHARGAVARLSPRAGGAVPRANRGRGRAVPLFRLPFRQHRRCLPRGVACGARRGLRICLHHAFRIARCQHQSLADSRAMGSGFANRGCPRSCRSCAPAMRGSRPWQRQIGD